MSSIGKIISLTNPVIVEGNQGGRWFLYKHNNIFIGDRIITGIGDRLEILLINDETVIIENGQSWTPTTDTFLISEDFFCADARLSDSAKGESSISEQILQQMLVEEVMKGRRRPTSSHNEYNNVHRLNASA